MKLSSVLASVPLIISASAGSAFSAYRREPDFPGNLAAIVQGVRTAAAQGDPTGVLAALRNIQPITTAPSTPEEALTRLQAIAPATLAEYIANLEALNLIDSIDGLLEFVNGVAAQQSSTTNVNISPPDVIYPQKLSCDAIYTLDEDILRSAIFVPATFTEGRIPPIILFPGTGNFGYETFAGNFIPLLEGSDFADPVWVNVPDRLLNDAQKNAEFAAYAINYIASRTKRNVTMLAWSQGNIDTQWAFKYWPSTTRVTSDHVAISPDYAGTVLANFVSLPGQPLPPSILQQQYLQSSNFITTLRTCDGDSGYVPTTTIYSSFDQIVQPQQGTGASAFLKDARGVGVTNNQVQLICPGQPAGSFYTHEGVLYNPLSYALLRDAMTNPGPGRSQNLNLPSVCATYFTPGLTLGDFLVTENSIAISGLSILTYPRPVSVEPAISAYASICPTSTCLLQSSTSSVSSSSATASSTTMTSSPLTTTTVTSSLSSLQSATLMTTTTSTTSTQSSSSALSSSSTSTASNTADTQSTSISGFTSMVTKSSATSSSLSKAQISNAITGSISTTIRFPWATWDGSSIATKPSHLPEVTTAVFDYDLDIWVPNTNNKDSDKTSLWEDWSSGIKPSSTKQAAQVITKTWVEGTATYTRYIDTPPTDEHGSAKGTIWSTKTATVIGAGSSGQVPDGKGNDKHGMGNIIPPWSPVKATRAGSDQPVRSTISSIAYTTPISASEWIAFATSTAGASVSASATDTGIVKQYKGTAGKLPSHVSAVFGSFVGLVSIMAML